jgi:hypothetical protein
VGAFHSYSVTTEPFLRRVSSLQITERFITVKNNSAEKCTTLFVGDYFENSKSQGICCAKRLTYSLPKNHTMGSLCINSFHSPYVTSTIKHVDGFNTYSKLSDL